MNVILNLFANWLYKYGKTNAGIPSLRGSYEAPVPQQLRDNDQE